MMYKQLLKVGILAALVTSTLAASEFTIGANMLDSFVQKLGAFTDQHAEEKPEPELSISQKEDKLFMQVPCFMRDYFTGLAQKDNSPDVLKQAKELMFAAEKKAFNTRVVLGMSVLNAWSDATLTLEKRKDYTDQAKRALEKFPELARPNPTEKVTLQERVAKLAERMCQGDMLLKLSKTYPSIQRLLLQNCSAADYQGFPLTVLVASNISYLWGFMGRDKQPLYRKQAQRGIMFFAPKRHPTGKPMKERVEEAAKALMVGDALLQTQ